MEAPKTQTSEAPVSTIADIGRHEGQQVTVRGWLYNLRESGKLLFPIFRDGTGVIQGVLFKKAVPEELFESVRRLQLESSVVGRCKMRSYPRAPSGYELDVSHIE